MSNKYLEALNFLSQFEKPNAEEFGKDFVKVNTNILQELVDKETPIKVEKDDGCLWWHCPKCKGLSNFYSDYCSSCGQKLDWE